MRANGIKGKVWGCYVDGIPFIRLCGGTLYYKILTLGALKCTQIGKLCSTLYKTERT